MVLIYIREGKQDFIERMMMRLRFISENIDDMEFKYGYLNLIVSGTGTGKSEFIRRELLNKFPDVKPSEVLYVTSRSMTRDQQGLSDGINSLNLNKNEEVIRYWNGATLKPDGSTGIWIMNYWQLTHIMDFMCSSAEMLFQRIKVAVFDECHAIYSDRFIKELIAVRMWMRERTKSKDMILIGLTATPGIVEHYSFSTGIPVRRANKDDFINYKAKNLYCTTFDCIPEMFKDGTLSGTTIIMCNSIAECNILQKQLSDSVVMCSASNSSNTHEMDTIRDYIINNGVLPDKTHSGRTLKMLITTTTMREGINLISNSGIKNVVSCVSDELHVKQFVGRCRFNVENLIVANCPRYVDAGDSGGYITQSRRKFRDFIDDPDATAWFASIADIVECKPRDVIRYGIDKDPVGFDKEFEERFASCKERIKRIYTPEDKNAIVNIARKYRVLDVKGDYTFAAVVKYIKSTDKYYVLDGQNNNTSDGRSRYKIFMKKEEANVT